MASEVQRIIDQILSDARENAKLIIDEARNSSDTAIEKEKALARQKAEAEIASIQKRGEDEVETTRRTLITNANRKSSWMVLSEKGRLVTSVLDEVKTQLRTFSQSEKYISNLQKSIIDAGIVMSGGKLEVLLREQDSKLPLKLSILAKTIEEETGKETELEISNERIESLGGCVIRTCDSRIMVDNTFPTILKRYERKLRSEIAKILFR